MSDQAEKQRLLYYEKSEYLQQQLVQAQTPMRKICSEKFHSIWMNMKLVHQLSVWTKTPVLFILSIVLLIKINKEYYRSFIQNYYLMFNLRYVVKKK